MSTGAKGGPLGADGMVPEEAEEFMAVLLWAQSAECTCPATAYFKKMGSKAMEKFIPDVSK